MESEESATVFEKRANNPGLKNISREVNIWNEM
jgi:hypothetical protein